jgi:hypothetical protein
MKRKLTVEDFKADYAARPASILRLKGQWLRAAGFHPGATVELAAISPGVIEIRVCGPASLSGESFTVMGTGIPSVSRAVRRSWAKKAGLHAQEQHSAARARHQSESEQI